MAITANVDLGNGASASSCYIIVPNAHVKKFRPEEDGESATEYNKRLLAWYQRQNFPFKTVGEMHATMGTQKLFKELTTTKGVRGISAPRSSSSVPR